MVTFTARRAAGCVWSLRRRGSLLRASSLSRSQQVLPRTIGAPLTVTTRRASHRSKDGDASTEEEKAMLDELYAMYQQQLDEVKLMRAMLGDGDMPEELLEEVKGEVAKLEAELKQLRAELGDAGHDEAGDAGELAGDELVRSWTHVELTKHAGLQLAQHNRIADNTWYWEEYGDFLWSPAIALARWLAQESIALEDKTVLELGAGLGLPGVTAATVGARQVLIQDQLEVSLREVTATAARNGVDDRVSTLACAWDDLGRQLPVDFREPDVVLGSCLLYEPDTSLALAGSLSQVLKGPGVAYIVAAEWEGSQDVFIDHCKEACSPTARSSQVPNESYFRFGMLL